jgi:predicted nucleic acid-binding protein
MAHYYLDSSALVKRYVTERGTTWVEDLCEARAGHMIYTVRVSGAEIIAALFRRARSGSLSLAAAQAEAAQFKIDLANDYQVVEVTESVVDIAMRLAEQHGLRGYDAVQLAAALSVHAARATAGLPLLNFVSADTELNTAAAAEGLPVEDPNVHP